jgi:tetratricopeptide (TPR) repeat protein
MKKFTMSLVLLAFLSLRLSAQQDIALPGEVVEQNSKFNTGAVHYLPNTEIKAEGNSTASDARGRFTLVFADKPLGNLTWIHAAKNGYVLVNQEELKKAAVIGRSSPIRVVMCAQDKLYENQMAYYHIARDAKMDAYRKQVATLEQDGEEKTALIAYLESDFHTKLTDVNAAKRLLESQLERAQRQAQELAEKFVTLNLDDQSETYRMAFRAFLAKDIDKAIRIMDSVDLRVRIECNQSLIKQIDQVIDDKQMVKDAALRQIQQDVEQAILSARMHKLNYRFHEADSLFTLALRFSSDSSNLDLKLEFAEFLRDQWQFERARLIFEDLLDQYRQLAIRNPDGYLPLVARVFENLGSLCSTMKACGEAKVHYEEALTIWRKMAQKNPDGYLPKFAKALLHLGAQDKTVVRPYHLEALGIMRKMARKQPEIYSNDVAKILSYLAGLNYQVGEVDLANRYWEESLDIQRALAAQNPDEFFDDLASILLQRGLILHLNNNNTEAGKYLEEALGHWQELARKDTHQYSRQVAQTLNFLGKVSETQGDLAISAEWFEKALAAFDQLLLRHPNQHWLFEVQDKFSIANIHYNLLQITSDQQHYHKGLAYLAEARRLLVVSQDLEPYFADYIPSIDIATQLFITYEMKGLSLSEQIHRYEVAIANDESIHGSKWQKALIEALDTLLSLHPDSSSLKSKLINAYSRLSWYQLLNKEFPISANSARKGLTLAPGEANLVALLALSLLYQDRWAEAIPIFTSLQKQPNFAETFRVLFLHNLDALEKAGIKHPDVEQARKLLR